MNIGSKRNDEGAAGALPDLPAWPDCDLFCIHNYAGSSAPPCGWRGRIPDARRDDAGTALRCPRCGGATLLRIPGDLAQPARGGAKR